MNPRATSPPENESTAIRGRDPNAPRLKHAPMIDYGHYETCATCGRPGWSKKHACPPTWRGWVNGCGDEAAPDTVYADDPEGAAEGLVRTLGSDPIEDETVDLETFEVFVFIPNEVEDDMLKVRRFIVTGRRGLTTACS